MCCLGLSYFIGVIIYLEATVDKVLLANHLVFEKESLILKLQVLTL